MQEWVIQIPSIPILVSVLFPFLHFRIKVLILVGASLSEPHMDGTSAIFHILLLLLLLLSYVRRGLCDPFFFFLRRALCGLYTVQSSCILYTKMDKREKCLQRRRERERSRRASETAEEREERLIKRRVSMSAGYSRLQQM